MFTSIDKTFPVIEITVIVYYFPLSLKDKVEHKLVRKYSTIESMNYFPVVSYGDNKGTKELFIRSHTKDTIRYITFIGYRLRNYK